VARQEKTAGVDRIYALARSMRSRTAFALQLAGAGDNRMQNAGRRTERSLRQRMSGWPTAIRLWSREINSDRLGRNAKLLIQHPRTFFSRVRAFVRHATRDTSYESWVRQCDTITADDIGALRAAGAGLTTKISIVMPVYNTPEGLLERAIDSIRAQAYENWQLCIADDASPAPHIRPLLQRYERKDGRIKVCYRTDNGGISEASNSALALATGDYVAFVDHDDEIPPHALLMVARAIAENPGLDLIYSDEDKIDSTGWRYEPYFKPDWNPALILSQNYFSHLGVYRRSLIEKAGGFRSDFNGSQDYDLLLRCSELTTPDRIGHIPHVLYHWRAIAGSTADAADAKPYALSAARRAIEEALVRRGIKGSVEQTRHHYYQVRYELSAPPPLVSILVPSACTSDLVDQCLAKLGELTTYPSYEVLLLVSEAARKDKSRRAILDRAARHKNVRVEAYPERPFNYSWVNNWGAKKARGSVLCFLNDDTEVITPDWLEQLVARVEQPGVAAAGTMMYYPDDRIQHAGVILGSGGVADHAHRFHARYSPGYFGRAALEQDLSCVTAGCAAVSRKAFDSVGGFDEKLAIAFNDVDFCIRLKKAGWRILWTPAVELYHHESASLGPHNSPQRTEQFQREVSFMMERWGNVLAADPHYNPNLSLEITRCFELAFPPRVSWREALTPVTKRDAYAHATAAPSRPAMKS
jgi:GT2 family glycosyltransferase